ncbi:MAG: hypothetical protein RQ826_12710 [Xanthomonadales bacterium]|nr:hypothetical protein [Xanthomonadales bacterium]
MLNLNTKKLSRLLLSGFFLLPSIPWAQEEQKPTLSLEEIVTLRQVDKAVISPNGEAVAYLLSVPRTPYADEDGLPWMQLHVVSVDGRSRPYFTGEVNVTDVAWLGDGNDLLFLAKRDAEAEFADIYRKRLDGGAAPPHEIDHAARMDEVTVEVK